MAVTYTRVLGRNGIPLGGGLRLNVIRADITAYVSGGVPLAAKDAGFTKLHHVQAINSEPTTAANRDSNLEWDKTNLKLYAIVVSTGAEAGAIDLGTYDLLVLGR